MASATASCPLCHSSFTGYGKNHAEAVADANTTASHHAMACAANPANQED